MSLAWQRAVRSELVIGHEPTIHTGWPGVALGVERRELRRTLAGYELDDHGGRVCARQGDVGDAKRHQFIAHGADVRAVAWTTCPLRRAPGHGSF